VRCIADWGKPADPIQRGLFLAVQLLDGFRPTRDHAAGRLTVLLSEAGFTAVSAPQRFRTLVGTLVLYRGVKPSARG
jgi:hypothetical protein